MNFIKNYNYFIGAYIVVFLYIIFGGNQALSAVLVTVLFLLNIYAFTVVKETYSKENEDSVSTLLTKLDKTKKKNEETYKQFISLSKTMGSGLFMVNEEGFISFSNKDVENYFDVDFNNQDYKELASVKPLYKFVNKAYLLEETIRKQIKYEERYFDLTSTPMFEGGIFVGTLVLVHDITQLKTAEKFQKRFTADVSHELKTPLAAIKGISEIMKRDKDMAVVDREEFVDLIHKESIRMEIILNDLMTISRLDRLDHELDLEDTEIEPLLKESLSVLDQRFKDKGLKKVVEIEPCVLQIDKHKMTQVVLNIVKNAINYTDNGFVKIEGIVQEDTYLIKISDSGIGISEKNLEQIFKRFYRVDKARSRDTGGSGLGLSISKNVMMKHGGSITVDSNVDLGSSFNLLLPLKK